jgi:quercetin dioxygenase-like cupin family protein
VAGDTFAALADMRPYAIWGDQVVARAVQGERLTMAVVDLAPNSEVPEHAHDNEQLGLVLQGRLRFTVGDDVRDLEVGDTYSIPSNVPHHVSAGPEGCTVVDVFAPTRQDWEQAPRLEARPGAWPS